MLKVDNFFNYCPLYIDEVNLALSWSRHDIHEIADVGCIDNLPLASIPHEVLWLELAIVLVTVKEEP